MIIMLMRMLPMLLLLAEDKTDLFNGKGLLETVMNIINNTIGGFIGIVQGLNNIPEITADINFTAFGQTLTALFFIMQAFEQMTDFRFDRMEDGIKLGLKFVMAKVIIENSSDIVGAIYEGIFKQYGLNMVVSQMGTFQSEWNAVVAEDNIDPGLLGINYLLSGILMIVVWLILLAMLVKMAATIAGIIFEIAMHKVVAPIALSTLCNDTAKSCGISFIKSYAAVCLQACVISVCFALYPSIAQAISDKDFTSGLTSASFIVNVFKTVSPIISITILSTTISKSGEITKRMLGA